MKKAKFKIPRFLVELFVAGLVIGVAWVFDHSVWRERVQSYYDYLVLPIQTRSWEARTRMYEIVIKPWKSRQYQQELLIWREAAAFSASKDAEFAQLKAELENLRALAKISGFADGQYVVSRVISFSGDQWRIGAGSSRGIEEGMPVLVNGVLWGKVASVSDYASWVIPLNGQGQEWPVEVITDQSITVSGVLSTRDGAMVVGGLLISDPVSVGNLVVSVGSGKIPGGLAIGRVIGTVVPDEGSLYQYARIAWPIAEEDLSSVVVLVSW